MMTLEELCERLKQIDEISLMEVLQLESHDLVEAFKDKIAEMYDELVEDLNDV